jgi:hypothetical protein
MGWRREGAREKSTGANIKHENFRMAASGRLMPEE